MIFIKFFGIINIESKKLSPLSLNSYLHAEACIPLAGFLCGCSTSASAPAFLLNFTVNYMIKELTTQQKGITTEIFVAARLLQLGYNVSQPFCQDSKYDLIVDANNHLYRLQVKTARQINEDTILFNCRSTTKNSQTNKSRYYQENEIDYFATYWNNEVFLIPVSECSSEKRLHLTPVKQSTQTYAYDYLASEVLKNL